MAAASPGGTFCIAYKTHAEKRLKISTWAAATVAAAMLLGAPVAAAAEDAVARGDYLVNSIMGCGNCHTPQGPGGPDMARYLAGGMAMEEESVWSVRFAVLSW